LVANEGIISKEDAQSRTHTQRGTNILFGPDIQRFEETQESDFDQDLDSYFIIIIIIIIIITHSYVHV
jgi:hypothetical protein